MTQAEMAAGVKRLVEAFPYPRKKLSPERLEVWWSELQDIPVERFRVAVGRCIELDTFFPSPARLRLLAEKTAEEKRQERDEKSTRKALDRRREMDAKAARCCSLQDALDDWKRDGSSTSRMLVQTIEKLRGAGR